jgi:2-hydroxy-6-oxonona-2,4-dienedioate hydrolase
MTASFWNALSSSEPVLRRVDVAGIPTRVLEAGPRSPASDNETIILIHGASGHLESFVYTLPVLAQAHRTIAFDLPFHGYAGYAEHPYSVLEHARYLAALAESLGVGQVSFVGQSLGGAIAARATVDGLLDVQRLVLIGSAGMARSTPDERHTMRAALTDRSLPVVRARLEHAMTSRGPHVDELIECRYRAYQLGDWQRRLDAFTYHETPEGRRQTVLSAEEWRAITCPVLLIWGDQDAVVPPATGKALASLIPDSRLMVVAGAGHNPQFELADQVNPALADFFGVNELAREG